MREILPNVIPSLIILAALRMATIIITEAALSFLGLGIQPPTPAWGAIINDGRDYLIQGSWWISTIPGLAVAAAVARPLVVIAHKKGFLSWAGFYTETAKNA